MTCHGVPEMVIVKGRVAIEGDLIRVAEGYGQVISRSCYTPFVYDKINGKHDEDSSGEIKNGMKHLDFTEEDQFDRNYQPGPAFSVSGESVISTATNHTARAPRPDGQRNMQSSSFSISGTTILLEIF